jgi:hypothetical protein
MHSRGLLSLLGELLRDIDEAGAFQVIPILVDEMGLDLELISATLRRAGGHLVAAPDVALGTSGVADPGLEAVVASQLSAAALGTVTIESRPSGQIIALLDGAEADGSTNAAAPTFLGAAVALFDAKLRAAEIAAIAYEEGPLDVASREALWDLLTSQIAAIGALGSAKALVVIVGAVSTDYSLHCRPGLSARYRLAGGRMSRRRAWALDVHDISHLDLSVRPLFILFLGAGFSHSSGVPLGNHLRDIALQTMVGKDHETDPLVLTERFMELVVSQRRQLHGETFGTAAEYHESLTLERVLREERIEYLPDEMPTLDHFSGINTRALLGPGGRRTSSSTPGQTARNGAPCCLDRQLRHATRRSGL